MGVTETRDNVTAAPQPPSGRSGPWKRLRDWWHENREQKRNRTPEKKAKDSRALTIVATIALVLQSGLLFIALFEPGLPYEITKAPAENLASDQFLHTLEALTSGHLHRETRFEVFTNGENFYEAELAAIRQAKVSVNLEAYIFQDDQIGNRFLEALNERARAGVKVNLLVDAIGSASLQDSKFKPLREAGGRMAWYHPLRWFTWPRINNRTHRELVIVDGKIGFVGGAGFADHWIYPKKDEKRWRDMMVRVEGGAVTGLQGAFAENWLESSGDLIAGREYFPFPTVPSGSVSLVIKSSPSSGRSTEARILFQTLLASAKQSIYITTPYFLPDKSIRTELVRAVKERGVDVRVVVPGKESDHLLTRRSSRRLYGDLLQAGAKIYEYAPAMNHTKSLVIDGLWSVVGSTNMDTRSFGLNDEVNVAVLDRDFAKRITQDFWNDVGESHEITFEMWRKRPILERGYEQFGAILERQQ